MDELSHVFSPVAEKELLVNATSLWGGGLVLMSSALHLHSRERLGKLSPEVAS